MGIAIENGKSVSSEPLKNSDNKPAKKSKKKEKDLYTETPLRKLGFLDEIGEAFRPILSTSKNPLIKNLPNYAYIPATLYIAADVADKYKKGLDGTGEKPSVKMAAREAAYQGIVSVLAPVGIVKGVHKITANVMSKTPKLPKGIQDAAEKGMNAVKNNKTVGKVLSKAGMPAKILGAVVSVVALSKLTKPVDKITSKFFEKVIDPKIGVGEKKENIEEDKKEV